MRRTVFTIDPGMSGTGVAIWDHERFENEKIKPFLQLQTELGIIGISTCNFPLISPEEIMQLRFKSKDEYINQLYSLLHWKNCARVICEDADFRRGDKGSMVAESGDLVTLAKFIGSVEATAILKNIPVELVTANKWKGQLDKKKTVDRIKKLWPASVDVCGNERTAHAWDAVGIGYWKLGMF